MSLSQWVAVDHLTHPRPVPETPAPQKGPHVGQDTLVGSKPEDLELVAQDFNLRTQNER